MTGNTVASLLIEFGSETSGFIGGLGIVTSGLTSVASLAMSVGSTVASAFNLPSKAVTALGGMITDVGDAITSAGNQVKAATAELESFGVQAVDLAGKLEQSNIAFETLTGSAQQATQILSALQDLADVSPFTFQGIQQTSKQLLASGEAAEELVGTLTAVGDAVSAIGGSNAVIERVVHNFAQMRAQGLLTGRDLRDLASTGLPIYDILAEKLGVTVPEALDMVHKHAITAADGLALLTEGFEERFGGAMAKQAETLQGLWSTFADVSDRALTHVGQKIVETLDLKSWVKEGIGAIGELTDWFDNLDPAIQQIAVQLGAAAVAAGHVLPIIGQVTSGFGAVTSALGSMLSPLGLVTTAVGAIGAAFAYLYATDETFAADIGEIFDAIGAAANELFSMMGFEADSAGDSITGSITAALDWIAHEMGVHLPDIIATIEALPAHLEPTINWIKKTFGDLFKWDTAALAKDFNAVIDVLVRVFNSATAKLEPIWTAISLALGTALSAAVDVVIEHLKDRIKAIPTELAASVSGLDLNAIGGGMTDTDIAGMGAGEHALGGLVTGPGSGTSDSIPAMLSSGEYVINAASASRIGIGRLDALNHFAEGGAVGGKPTEPSSVMGEALAGEADLSKELFDTYSEFNDMTAEANKHMDALNGSMNELAKNMSSSSQIFSPAEFRNLWSGAFGNISQLMASQMFPALDSALVAKVSESLDKAIKPFTTILTGADYNVLIQQKQANTEYLAVLNSIASATSNAQQAMTSFGQRMDMSALNITAGTDLMMQAFAAGAAARTFTAGTETEAAVESAAGVGQGFGGAASSAMGLAGTLTGASNIIAGALGMKASVPPSDIANAVASAALGLGSAGAGNGTVTGSGGGFFGGTGSSGANEALRGISSGSITTAGGGMRPIVLNLTAEMDGETVANVTRRYDSEYDNRNLPW